MAVGGGLRQPAVLAVWPWLLWSLSKPSLSVASRALSRCDTRDCRVGYLILDELGQFDARMGGVPCIVFCSEESGLAMAGCCSGP